MDTIQQYLVLISAFWWCFSLLACDMSTNKNLHTSGISTCGLGLLTPGPIQKWDTLLTLACMISLHAMHGRACSVWQPCPPWCLLQMLCETTPRCKRVYWAIAANDAYSWRDIGIIVSSKSWTDSAQQKRTCSSIWELLPLDTKYIVLNNSNGTCK